jgi:hypothetical protein
MRFAIALNFIRNWVVSLSGQHLNNRKVIRNHTHKRQTQVNTLRTSGNGKGVGRRHKTGYRFTG